MGGVVIDGCGAAEVIPTAVCADDGQYALDPSNLATIVYSPVEVGIHSFLNIPLESLVTVPISVV